MRRQLVAAAAKGLGESSSALRDKLVHGAAEAKTSSCLAAHPHGETWSHGGENQDGQYLLS